MKVRRSSLFAVSAMMASATRTGRPPGRFFCRITSCGRQLVTKAPSRIALSATPTPTAQWLLSGLLLPDRPKHVVAKRAFECSATVHSVAGLLAGPSCLSGPWRADPAAAPFGRPYAEGFRHQIQERICQTLRSWTTRRFCEVQFRHDRFKPNRSSLLCTSLIDCMIFSEKCCNFSDEHRSKLAHPTRGQENRHARHGTACRLS